MKKIVSLKIEEEQWDELSSLHYNKSEFIRGLIDDYFERVHKKRININTNSQAEKEAELILNG